MKHFEISTAELTADESLYTDDDYPSAVKSGS